MRRPCEPTLTEPASRLEYSGNVTRSAPRSPATSPACARGRRLAPARPAEAIPALSRRARCCCIAVAAARSALPRTPLIVVVGADALRVRLALRRARCGARRRQKRAVARRSRDVVARGSRRGGSPQPTPPSCCSSISRSSTLQRSRGSLAAWRRRPGVPAAAPLRWPHRRAGRAAASALACVEIVARR